MNEGLMCVAASEAVRYEALNKDMAAAVLESTVVGGTQKDQLKNLVGNGISDAGAAGLAEALRGNTRLESLSLVGLNLETQAVIAAAATFQEDKKSWGC
jgi:hypothetical protein